MNARWFPLTVLVVISVDGGGRAGAGLPLAALGVERDRPPGAVVCDAEVVAGLADRRSQRRGGYSRPGCHDAAGDPPAQSGRGPGGGRTARPRPRRRGGPGVHVPGIGRRAVGEITAEGRGEETYDRIVAQSQDPAAPGIRRAQPGAFQRLPGRARWNSGGSADVRAPALGEWRLRVDYVLPPKPGSRSSTTCPGKSRSRSRRRGRSRRFIRRVTNCGPLAPGLRWPPWSWLPSRPRSPARSGCSFTP